MNEGRTLPLFSVVVVCYKNTELTGGMVDSILMQDYPNIELIISDDGTPDFNCEEIEADIRSRIEELHTQNITRMHVRKNEENEKTVRHVAKALSMATGEYVVFTAADDRFANASVLSRYVRCFEEHPQSKWLVGNVAITSEDYQNIHGIMPAEVDKPYFEANDATRLFSRWSRRGMAIPCCMAFRPEAFDLAGGIDLSYTLLEDWPLVLHLLLAGYAPAYVDELVALHSTGGVTNSNARYGVEIRRIFYQDKYRLLDTITEKNLHLLIEEDRRCYRLYRKEIMDRNYFLQIDIPTKSKAQLLKQCLCSCKCFFWMMEHVFWKVESRIQGKVLLILSQVLLAVSALLFDYAMKGGVMHNLFGLFAWLDVIGAFGCMSAAFGKTIMKLIFERKNRKRRELVN